MNNPIRLTLLTLACGAAPALAGAQATGLPTAQPTLVTIVRNRSNWPHSRPRQDRGRMAGRLRQGEFPDYYLAMISLTGQPEAWYIIPAASHAAYGEQMSRYDKDAATTAELERLSRADADVLDGIRTVQATARTDLSMGTYPDLARQRFWEITIFRVRPGHEEEFAAAAKAYMSSAQRGAPNTQFRTYEVIAGMLQPTYIVFSSVPNYGEFDRMLQDGMKTMQGANAEEQAALRKFFTDGMISSESNRFRLDPKQSYVSRETRATDPAFWGTMPPARAAVQPPAKRP
jgi:hypothetical protein